MEVRNFADEGPKNLTWNNDSINITDHTSQINAISQLGSDPDQWLLALRGLEELENGPRKRKLVQYFFLQSGKILDSSELRRSRSYAVLLGKEALHYAEIDAEDARHIFQMGLLKCQRVPVLYVMFAQFELDYGRKDKALKILQHGQVCVENASEIIAAKTKLERGCKRIDGSKEKQIEWPLKNITNRTTEQTSVFVKRNADVPDENRINTQRPVRLSVAISTQSGHGHFPSKEQIENSRFSFPSNMSKPSMSNFGNLTPVLENDISAAHTTTEVATSNCKFQTPPLHRSTQLCKTLDLGLTLDSPASPDLSNFTFDLTSQSKTEINSETVSNAHPEIQSGSATNKLETVAKSSVPSSLTRSEKKFSPVSRMRQMTSQTTGKKPARVPPSTAPRRVLLKGGKSQWSDSDSEDDVRPLQKSPDDKNGIPQAAQSKENQSAINHALTEKSLSPSRLPACEKENQMPLDVPQVKENVSIPNQQLLHPSAFKSYPKSGEVIPPTKSVPSKNPESYLVPFKHAATQEEIHSTNRNFHDGPIEAPKMHQRQNGAQNAVNNPQIRNRNPSDSSTASTNLGAGSLAPPVRPIAAHSWAPPPEPERYPREEARTVHPAFQLLKEKKMIEMNGTPYILLKLLGKGGSSKVYQVLNLKTSEISALKQVNLMGCENSVLEGYKNEIIFLKKLQGNQYIIKLIDYEIREHHLYLLMECGSLDLSAFLKKKKALNENLGMWSILVFWENMLRAVEAIHKHGVIHLDLKPANFMLIDYTLKLIDFGIANSIQVDATSIIKDTQFGTLNYMAPETINDLSGGIQTGSTYAPKFKVGPKADVWSLGCILYYIMYGKTPFQHIHHQTMKLFAITNDNHRIEFPDFPRRELVEIVQACLIRDPKRRPSVEMLLNHPLLK